MNNLFNRVLIIFQLMMLACLLRAEGASDYNLRLVRATYSNVTIQWDASSAVQIYRNGVPLAAASGTSYTDENLVAGTEYEYYLESLSALGLYSPVLKVKTLDPIPLEADEMIESAVDRIAAPGAALATASDIYSSVNNEFTPLSGVIDEQIVKDYIENELLSLKKLSPVTDAAQQALTQCFLDAVLNHALDDGSFDALYVRAALMSLAERHWQARKVEAAKALLEAAIAYSQDSEANVFAALSRLAYYRLSEIEQISTAPEVIAAIADAQACYTRFFDYFPGSSSAIAARAHRRIAYLYYNEFPRLLPYNAYTESAFRAAKLAIAEALHITPNSVNAISLAETIDAWELQSVLFQFPAMIPEDTVLTVENISVAQGLMNLYTGDIVKDFRSFKITGDISIPMYRGHIYRIAVEAPIADSDSIIFEIPAYSPTLGNTLTLRGDRDAAQTPSDSTGIVIDLSLPEYPYNLLVDKYIDTFNLSWSFRESSDFSPVAYKVFRGESEVVEVEDNCAKNLRLIHPDGVYTYKVVAYDAAGQASPPSKTVFVSPGAIQEDSDYFDWLSSHFGSGTTMLGTDDPDGDGVDNYGEYLAGTDPTRIPGPELYSGPRGYRSLTVMWDKSGDGYTYELRRNGAAPTVLTLTSESFFTDRDLHPDTEYSYSVRAILDEDNCSDWSDEFTISTQRLHDFITASSLATVIDGILPLATTAKAEDLFASIASARGGSSAALADTAVEHFVTAELLSLSWTPKKEAKELRDIRRYLMAQVGMDWQNASYEELYVHNALVDLAERYWLKYRDDRSRLDDRNTAGTLLELALQFIPSDPELMFAAVNRLADMRMHAAEDDGALGADLTAALAEQAAIRLRFIEMFGNEYSLERKYNPYIRGLHKYLIAFPRVLAYDSYGQHAFAAALALGENAMAFYADRYIKKLQDMISFWRLASVQAEVDPSVNGNVVIEVVNVSSRLSASPFLYSSDIGGDHRVFTLSAGSHAVPVYAGHLYDVRVTTKVFGGADWTRVIRDVRFDTGGVFRYQDNQWVSTSGSGCIFVDSPQPTAPYNLSAEIYDTTFTLSWDWVNGSAEPPASFNVYRGNELFAAVAGNRLENISHEIVAHQVYSYSVSAIFADGTESDRSEELNVLPNFTIQELTYYEWKQKWFGDYPMLASDDTDGDGLTNYQEFLLDSNPTLAAPDSLDDLEIARRSGAKAAYYAGVWTVMPDFSALYPYAEHILNRFYMDDETAVLSSGRSDYTGVVLTCYVDIAEDGLYNFYLSSDDACRVYIDGALRIANNELGSRRETISQFRLGKGTRAVRIEYFDYLGPASLKLHWSGPGFDRIRFDQSNLWYVEGDIPPEMVEYLKANQDSDGDGLSDFVEIRIGTDPNNRDTDGDGLDDWSEVTVYFTDPLNADTNGNGISDYDEIALQGGDPLLDLSMLKFASVYSLNGGDYISSKGRWKAEGGSAVAIGHRGSLSYDVSLPSNNIYRFEFDLENDYQSLVPTRVNIYLDGLLLAEHKIELGNKTRKISAFTPYLLGGDHVLTVEWDNHRQAIRLKVNSIDIASAASWSESPEVHDSLMAAILNRRNILTPVSASRTSPAPLSGLAAYPSTVSVNGRAAIPISGDGWYSEVELSPELSQPVTVAFENGGVEADAAIAWRPTNIFEEAGSVIKVRAGDSLLISAHSAKHESGVGSFTCEGQSYRHGQNDLAVPVRFPDVGSYTVTGMFTSADNQRHTAELTVEVMEYDFNNDDIVCIVGATREWVIPPLPVGVVLSFDSRILDSRVTREDDLLVAGVYIDDNRPRKLIARLGGDGPLMSMQTLSGISYYSGASTYIRMVDMFSDGSQLYEMQVILSRPRTDITVELDIFMPGVLFDDGTVARVITRADFDDEDSVLVGFVRSVEALSSVCHTLRLYQNGEYVGVRLK